MKLWAGHWCENVTLLSFDIGSFWSNWAMAWCGINWFTVLQINELGMKWCQNSQDDGSWIQNPCYQFWWLIILASGFGWWVIIGDDYWGVVLGERAIRSKWLNFLPKIKEFKVSSICAFFNFFCYVKICLTLIARKYFLQIALKIY